MPEVVASAAADGPLVNSVVGFCGKIPARGDFVRAGLPRTFTEPWDRWMEQMIAASRSALGEAWLPAWLEAPVWRFALSAGICGPEAAIGLWMPSVDRIGRYYPLTIAAVTGLEYHCRLIREAGGFLAAGECAGRDALEHRLPPDELARRLDAAVSAPPADPGIGLAASSGGALWWSRGAPRVPDAALASAGLLDENTFLAMVDPCISMLAAPRQA